MKRHLAAVPSLPYALVVSWVWVGFMILIRAAHRPRWVEPWILVATWRGWALRRWRYSTTLGRGIIMQPHHGDRTWRHELVHVRQVEDLCWVGMLIGILVLSVTGNWVLGATVWLSSGAWQLPNFLTGWLRYGDAYRGSEHERAAYAQDDQAQLRRFEVGQDAGQERGHATPRAVGQASDRGFVGEMVRVVG